MEEVGGGIGTIQTVHLYTLYSKPCTLNQSKSSIVYLKFIGSLRRYDFGIPLILLKLRKMNNHRIHIEFPQLNRILTDTDTFEPWGNLAGK